MKYVINIPEKVNNRLRSFLGHGYALRDEDVKIIADAIYDAQPERKKGKWIVHPEVKNVYGGTYIECSQCGEKYVVQHMEDEKYCRNCGAKMETEYETWNGICTQITAPKGTFAKIFNDNDTEDDGI